MIRQVLGNALEYLGAIWQLLRLGVITRFRFSGPYWSWRMATAYGRGKPDRPRMLLDIIAHARWIHRSRRGM